jgi:hypothetical protein
MAAARRLRLRAAPGEAVVAWFAELSRAACSMPGAASGQAPTAPAADRRVREVSLPEAVACRQRMAAEPRLARSSAAAASARRWAAPVALAAAVAQPSEQPAAWDAAAAEGVAAVA